MNGITGNQLQEQNWKIHKYVGIKHATEEPMGQGISQKRNFKNTLRQMKMAIQHTKIM